MTRAKYRLPAALGGGEFVGQYLGYDQGTWRYEGHLDGFGTTYLGVAHELEEIKPPSIDDPVDLPLRIAASSGDRPEREVWLKRHGDETVLDITGDGILIHGRATLDPEGLRLLARAAWQRANVLEATS